jgi:hypothetical protein
MRSPSTSSLIKLVLIAGGVALVAKLITAKKGEWTGLSETEVREKLEARMPDRVPDDKRAAVADKVVGAMRTRGLLQEPAAAGEEVTSADDAEAVEEDTDDAGTSQ